MDPFIISELLYPAIFKHTSQITTFPPLFIKSETFFVKGSNPRNGEDSLHLTAHPLY